MSPTPSSSSDAASGGIASTSALESSILEGSAYFITDVNTGAGTISGENGQGTFTAPYDASTRFRRAQIDRFEPSDPYYDAVVAYNASNGLGDTFDAALLALEGGNARIIVQFDNGPPPSPIRILSFQPIP